MPMPGDRGNGHFGSLRYSKAPKLKVIFGSYHKCLPRYLVHSLLPGYLREVRVLRCVQVPRVLYRTLGNVGLLGPGRYNESYACESFSSMVRSQLPVPTE